MHLTLFSPVWLQIRQSNAPLVRTSQSIRYKQSIYSINFCEEKLYFNDINNNNNIVVIIITIILLLLPVLNIIVIITSI